MADNPNSDPQTQGVQATSASGFQALTAVGADGKGTKLVLVPDTTSDQTYLDARVARWDTTQNLLFPKAKGETMLIRVSWQYKLPTLLPSSLVTIGFRNLASGRLISPHTFTPVSTLSKILDIDGINTTANSDSYTFLVRPITPASMTAGLQVEAISNNSISIKLTNIHITVL